MKLKLTQAQPRSLDEMQHYSTSYAVDIDGTTVTYTARKTKQNLQRIMIEVLRDHPDYWDGKVSDTDEFEYKNQAWHIGSITAKFGNTERNDASLAMEVA